MTSWFKVFLVTVFGLSSLSILGQDSLVIQGGPMLTGEIKGMDKGVLTLDTEFGDSDLKIKWERINWIRSSTFFTMLTSEGQRIYGRLTPSELGPGNVSVGPPGQEVSISLRDVVRLDPIQKDFWGKFNASLDLGFSLTKANDQRQLSVRGNVRYKARDWSLSTKFDGVQTDRSDAERVRRATWSNVFRRTLFDDVYAFATLEFFTSDEQQLDLRSTSIIGVGAYFVYNADQIFSGNVGLANNNESFQPEALTSNRNSWEGFIGLDYNAYGLEDLDILTGVDFYPGLTEKGRYRVNFKFDLKYDLPRDFYIKLGYSHNYDSSPPEGTDPSDYVATTGFGWEW